MVSEESGADDSYVAHRIYCSLSNRVMKNSVDNHLRPIVNNVVDNYPYYNRSFGHDHFLVYPYDFGVLCSGRHLREDWSEIENCQVDTSVGHKYFCHVSRILNTSFIGNYGMDSRYYTENEYSFGLNKCIGASCPTVACHRPDIDIVTPQYLTTDTHDCYSDLDANKSLFVHRKFDSCFQGNYLYQRSILENMKHDNSIHYTQNNTDRFQETDDLFKCIFAYHMCGQACWSKRLYDALALGAVPIIVADGAIQAFERFLDWRQFTIKISVPELFQDKFSYRFRHILRRQSDLFRREVGQYASSPPGFVPIKSSMMGDATSLRSKGSNNKFGFVLRKMVNGRSSVEWFNFRDLQLEVNAFRMLVLEMFCRIVRRRMLRPSSPCAAASANRPEEGVRFSQMNSSSLAADPVFQCYVCSRKSDFIARMRFVR